VAPVNHILLPYANNILDCQKSVDCLPATNMFIYKRNEPGLLHSQSTEHRYVTLTGTCFPLLVTYQDGYIAHPKMVTHPF